MKNFFLAIALLFFFHGLFGQSEDQASTYVVTSKGDTIPFKIKRMAGSMGETRLVGLDNNNNKITYYARELKSFYDGKYYYDTKVLDNQYKILKKLIDGPAKLYTNKYTIIYYGANPGDLNPNQTVKQAIVQKGEDRLIILDGLFGPKDKQTIINYFNDFPEVNEETSKRGYPLSNLEELVKRYNLYKTSAQK